MFYLTSYDDIYTAFITNCQTEDINLPESDEKIYDAIHAAIRSYNNKFRTNITCDDNQEAVNAEFNDDDLLIVSHYLRLSFLENQLIYFTTTWQPFSKELGLKNYQTQAKSLELLVDLQKQRIDEVIRNTEVDFL